jgi:hypothetical protein
MAKEWTDEEVTAAISEAVAIVREDRIDALIRKRLSDSPANPNDPGNAGNSGDGNPNPNPANKKKGSLWWGDTE